MAFVFNATPSATTANSYATVSIADDYFSGRFGADHWFELDSIQREKLLVSATRAIDTSVFGGLKSTPDQSLLWPRTGLYDRENKTITGIPTKLIEAICELAVWYWTESDRILSDNELMQIDSYKVGPLDVKFSADKMTFPVKVNQLLNSIGPGVVIADSTDSRPAQVRFSR